MLLSLAGVLLGTRCLGQDPADVGEGGGALWTLRAPPRSSGQPEWLRRGVTSQQESGDTAAACLPARGACLHLVSPLSGTGLGKGAHVYELSGEQRTPGDRSLCQCPLPPDTKPREQGQPTTAGMSCWDQAEE